MVSIQHQHIPTYASQELNTDPSSLRPVVGRISLIREPTPVILGALHLTLNNDFDMDEIFGYLIEEDNSAVSH
jgi:hypothetical protein